MSFWDRYLAPGDIRQQRQFLEAQRIQAEQEALQKAIKNRPKALPVARADAATRARRQNGLVFGGIIFTAFSIFVTRRTVARKTLSTNLTAPDSAVPTNVVAGLDAAHALTLATLNVFSIGMLGLGILAKSFDVADVEDMRNMVRRGAGFDVYGGEEEADKELEEWVTEVLLQKDGVFGLKESVAAKLAEMQKLEKEKSEVVAPKRVNDT